MLFSLDGVLYTSAAFVNVLTVASFLGITTENTRAYVNNPLVRVLFLYTFAFSVIPQKIPCLIAVAMFVALEVQNFIQESLKKDD